MTFDEHALGELLEESQDLQSDAMSATGAALNDMVEIGHDRRAQDGRAQGRGPAPDVAVGRRQGFSAERRRLMRQSMVGAGALATAGFGARLLALMESPAFALQGEDTQIMQTAASLENLAVATYTVALTLPFMAAAPPVVKAFATKTKEQHAEHAKAFNAAATRLGGRAQNGPDPVLAKVVEDKKPALKSALDVVDLAIMLETGAAQTYSANTVALQDVEARKVVASVMGVEAQHVAILNAVKVLLAANAPQLITLPPDATKLPAAAGSIGFPEAFLKTDQARPSGEGALK